MILREPILIYFNIDMIKQNFENYLRKGESECEKKQR